MIVQEMRLLTNDLGVKYWKEGYFISRDELKRLVRDLQDDCHNGVPSNDDAYIEHWLSTNKK